LGTKITAGSPQASSCFIDSSASAMALWITTRPSSMRAMIIWRWIEPPGISADTRHRLGVSFSIGS
jgi:hypothetical protein